MDTTKEKQYFSLEDANEMIPTLEQYFKQIALLQVKMRKLKSTLEDEIQMRNYAADIADILHDMTDVGIEVVDLELGIVNFYTWDEDEELVLSWQYGESAIHFWHEPFEDFCHRRPLKQIFAEVPKQGPMVH